VKDSWGGKGSPFPRKPEIPPGTIDAVAGEPGTPLNLHDLIPSSEENFLDLAGWKDATGMRQPSVTASSQNTYSDRDDVARLYDDENERLSNSKFWYHAELFEHDRLNSLLAPIGLGSALTKQAALLCYYFFFPAHAEPVANEKTIHGDGSGSDLTLCTNVEAKEFNNFAGEWACMAVLLDRSDPTKDFAPQYLGFSGRLTENGSPAQMIDGYNVGKGLVMTVVPFHDPQVQLIDGTEHPQLFVSKGTHAFYLAPGKRTLVFPLDSPSYECGLFEGPPGSPPDTGSSLGPPGASIWYAKVLAGGSLFGPIGALAGAIWGLAEYTEGDYHWDPPGVDLVGTATVIATVDDETGDPGKGKVVRPKGLPVPLAGPDQTDWLSQQNLPGPDHRRYDFLVDRKSQLWWPGDFQGGYQGRWGPRVEADRYDRRAGMKFPAFWKTFFYAFVIGKSLKAF
jgi:hypothetical protein